MAPVLARNEDDRDGVTEETYFSAYSVRMGRDRGLFKIKTALRKTNGFAD